MNRAVAFRILAVTGCLAVAVAASLWAYDVYWPRPLPARRTLGLPASTVSAGRVVIRVPGQRLVGELARYNDELSAYLMFDYLRNRPALRNTAILLTHSLERSDTSYRIRALMPDDLAAGAAGLHHIAGRYPFLKLETSVVDERVVREWRSQTQAFQLAYSLPANRKLERLTPREVADYSRRFIHFKSTTDPRTFKAEEPAPRPPDPVEAQSLADDIVTVAAFFDLPVDFLLGIGAMENNYLNVRGDIGNAVWKRKAEKGDVIIGRRRGRVRVLNESSGIWQITRETLRVAHRRYRQDTRDYSVLPEHLRPSQDLDLDNVDPRLLTTYAGIVLRDLLDRFDGDIGKAVGAYNGGPGNPNPRYEAGVRLVAGYARRMLEQSAALRGQRVADLKYFRPAAN